VNTAALGPEVALRRVLWVLAPAITLVVATEFIVVGLLPLVAADRGVSLAEAGRLTGLFAFSAAVAGPFVTLWASRWAPRDVLAGTVLLFAAGNIVMAVANDFTWLLVARIVQGAALPAFVSVGAAAVSSLAPIEQRGRALANANIGFVVGVLVALPAGVALAQGGSWRLPFFALIGLASPIFLLIRFRFPTCRPAGTPRVSEQLALLRSPVFLGHLVLSVVLFAAMFSSYTFLGAWLDRRLGLSPSEVAVALFLFSAVGMFGNGIAGRLSDHAPLQATAVAVVILAVAAELLRLVPHAAMYVAIPLALWSIAHTASVTLSQVRVTMAGGASPAFAMTLNLSAANLGIAVGAFAGGWTIDRWGMRALGWGTAAFAIATVALCVAVYVGARHVRRAA